MGYARAPRARKLEPGRGNRHGQAPVANRIRSRPAIRRPRRERDRPGGRWHRAGLVGGDGYGCFASGFLTTRAQGGEKNLLAAVRDFKKACDLRFPRGCAGLVRIYTDDPEGASKLFKQACGIDRAQCGELDALIEGIQAGAAFRKR